MLKKKLYRNRKLLDAFIDAPICFACFNPNDGTVVAAHSNQLRDGKGRGMKAHDYRVAGLCSKCHFQVDNGKIPRGLKVEMWENAHRNTIAWLFEEEIIRV